MKQKRIVILGVALLGICIGFIIGSYIFNPEGFVLKNYIGVSGVALATLIFVLGHIFSKEKKQVQS